MGKQLEEIDLERVVVVGGEGPVERFVNTVTAQPTGGDSWAHRFARDVDTFFNLR
jgi:hypothetical protein